MATPNPLEKTHAQRPPPVSKETHVIGGILCTVFGLQELLPESGDVACLWLLNPRLQTQACMEPVAFSAISHWNKRLKEKNELRPSLGLIAVSFDQRNHGSRMVDPVANEAWAAGNEKHAQDMFSIFRLSLSCHCMACFEQDLICRRWHFLGHFSIDYLSTFVHFPTVGAYSVCQHGPWHFPRRTRGMALYPP